MKQFTRVEPTDVFDVGEAYKHQIVVKRFKTDDGKSHEFTTMYGEDVRSCAVVAVTVDGKIIIAYQFRPGPERWMWELPGGGVNEGEDLETAAERELLEETGYIPGNVQLLGKNTRGPYFNIKEYFYLATDCVVSDQGPQRDHEEDEQGMEIRLITVDELIKNAKTDKMTDQVGVLMAYDKLMEIKGGTNG